MKSMNELPIVILDDENDALLAVKATLTSFKYRNIKTYNNVNDFLESLERNKARLILMDLIMPEMSGEEILEIMNERCPEIPIIMTTGVNEIKTAVRCMQKGAVDYLVKPLEREQLNVAVRKALRISELEKSNIAISESFTKSELEFPDAFAGYLTIDPNIINIFKYIEAVAPSSQSILITGETGTGKEMIARAVHTVSGRSGEFVPVNVAGLDDTMFSDALFGHEKGAFTGAEKTRSGFIEKAANGTLFLDEIGDLSIASQLKLLRLLQENEYVPLGSDSIKRSSCRVVTATSKPFKDLKNKEVFRSDLFYRLRTHHVHLPQLKDRKGDIPLLVNTFIKEAALELNKKEPVPHREIYNLLSTWHFPGNIRELKAIIYDAVANHKGGIMSLSIINNAIGLNDAAADTYPIESIISFSDQLPTFKDAENILLKEALKRSNGNQALAAKLLGVSRSAITQRLKKNQ